MEITSTDMANMIYDPMRIVKTVLSGIESDNNLMITNATNPFTMSLETSIVTANGSAIATRNNLRRMLPSLAETVNDLYTHLTDSELANMFAVPSNTVMAFMISIVDLKQYGYRPVNSNYVEMTIPANTYITVMKQTTLTLLNDIVITIEHICIIITV